MFLYFPSTTEGLSENCLKFFATHAYNKPVNLCHAFGRPWRTSNKKNDEQLTWEGPEVAEITHSKQKWWASVKGWNN